MNGVTNDAQTEIFTSGINLSSNRFDSIDMKNRIKVTKKHKFGMMGLFKGSCHVIKIKGIEAIAPANTEKINDHLGPLVFHNTMQSTVRMATNESIFVQPNLLLNTRAIVITVVPTAPTITIVGSIFLSFILTADIQASTAQRPYVLSDTPSPVPRLINISRYK